VPRGEEQDIWDETVRIVTRLGEEMDFELVQQADHL